MKTPVKQTRRFTARELEEFASYLAEREYERSQFLTLLSNKMTQHGSHIDSMPRQTGKASMIATDLKKLDAHVVQPAEYEDAPELTDAQLAAARVHKSGEHA